MLILVVVLIASRSVLVHLATSKHLNYLKKRPCGAFFVPVACHNNTLYGLAIVWFSTLVWITWSNLRVSSVSFRARYLGAGRDLLRTYSQHWHKRILGSERANSGSSRNQLWRSAQRPFAKHHRSQISRLLSSILDMLLFGKITRSTIQPGKEAIVSYPTLYVPTTPTWEYSAVSISWPTLSRICRHDSTAK